MRTDPINLGIVGCPLDHSMSPLLHARLGELTGLPLRYAPYLVRSEDDLAAALRRLRALGVWGLNVTIPYKVRAAELCDVLTPDARAAGAVNTLKLEGDRTFGHNTDVQGFALALEGAGIETARKRALVLGAGGAARAAALHLARQGAMVEVCARRADAAEALCAAVAAWAPAALTALPWSERIDAAARAALIVNATPIGLWPDTQASPVDRPSALRPDHAVLDMVYNPVETRLLALARKVGAQTVDGLGMLIHQGVAALEMWLGQRIEHTPRLVGALRDTLLEALEARRAVER